MTNIILCGGSGTRLWPINRTLMPKQFVKLFGNKSLFQLTVQRNLSLYKTQLIVSNTEHFFLAKDQLQELGEIDTKYLLEPIGRNTVPAMALACFELDSNETVLVTPSDHLIKNNQAYSKAIFRAKKLASQGNLVVFGINPTFAETGFGYIEVSGSNKELVKAFHEKPNLQTATKYLTTGNHCWNSGMFMFKVGVLLQELQKYSEEIYCAALHAFKNSTKDLTTRIQHNDMTKIPENSIDYAVLEKSDKVKMVKSDFGWSDVGSFDSLYEELPKDKSNNTINNNHTNIGSKNNLIFENKRKIATIDIEDLIIMDTNDAFLVSQKGSSQKVKQIVEMLKKFNTQLHNIHLLVERPWSTYSVLEDQNGFKIKKNIVRPDKRLSLQKHFHRSEHWITVKGTATVTNAGEKFVVRENESTYIKIGDIHRLENKGKIDLVVIKVQVGEYTGEDDIARLEDDYNREG